MVKAKRYVLVKRFDGFPKQDDLKIEEEELPALKDGGKSKCTYHLYQSTCLVTDGDFAGFNY